MCAPNGDALRTNCDTVNNLFRLHQSVISQLLEYDDCFIVFTVQFVSVFKELFSQGIAALKAE